MTRQGIRPMLHLLGTGLLVWACSAARAVPPAPLPSAAQEAIGEGRRADEKGDHPGAIVAFRKALRIAPRSPEVLFHLAVAEARMPGRELRAMAWLGAYLSAWPDAPNRERVDRQIAEWRAGHLKTLSRLIRAADDAVRTPHVHSVYLGAVAKSWADMGDLEAARRLAAFTENAHFRDGAYGRLALAEARAGDIKGAKATIELILDPGEKHLTQRDLVAIQLKAGDLSGAQATWKGMADIAALSAIELAHPPAAALIAEAQGQRGDRVGARMTLGLALQQAEAVAATQRDRVYADLAEAQARNGDVAGAQNTVRRIQDPSDNPKTLVRDAIALAKKTKRQADAGVGVEAWMGLLDDDNLAHACPLKSPIFLDQPAYLQALPLPEGPEALAERILDPIRQLILAQETLDDLFQKAAASPRGRKAPRPVST